MAQLAGTTSNFSGIAPLFNVSTIEFAPHDNVHIFTPVYPAPAENVEYSFINDVEREYLYAPKPVIVEPANAKTGIGLAYIAAAKGYRLILTIPETISVKHRNLLRALDAEVVLTPELEGREGAERKAEELRELYAHSPNVQNYENRNYLQSRSVYAAEEIWSNANGNVDICIAPVGSTVGEELKKRNPNIIVVAVETFNTALQSRGNTIILSPDYKTTEVDELLSVRQEDAYRASRLLAQREGLLVGVTSGATVHAAIEIAARSENKQKTIIAVLPNSGELYSAVSVCEREE
ncbi:MAG: pyridoxal-phosphate dependent enzyme [Bacteroidales bacterium]|jgi:cysteine synthase A|nr:pyridoxal-phosphate dependent enzyme [Bacteroidales bacterium]